MEIRRICCTCLLAVGFSLSLFAETIETPKFASQSASSTVVADTIHKKKSWFNRFLDYFNDANKEKSNKRFDFSIIGGPHYSTDTKLGLGLVAAGLYRSDRSDLSLPPSNVSLFGDISTVGFYLLGIRGIHIFPHDKYRLDYNIHFYSFPSYMWGVGYEMGNNDANKTKLDRWQSMFKASFLIKTFENFYVGPLMAFDFIKATEIEHPEILGDMDHVTRNFGIGFSMVYDSRDVLTRPQKGFYLNVSQCFRPAFMGNDYAFSTTDIVASTYKNVWKGGILAGEFRSQFNFGSPSWGMMAKLGSSNSMRGYYEGRYRDKHKMEAQIELRQHIWKRNGVVLWLGAGTVFDKFSSMRSDRILPNCGIGYRWEFKKNVNVRLDYGIGKSGQSGFMFNINEAF